MRTYKQAIADIREDMASEAYSQDESTLLDLADCLLHDPMFSKLARKKYPSVTDPFDLKMCIAQDILC